MLPPMEHAVRELRMLQAACGKGGTRTVQQTTRTVEKVLQANDDTIRSVRKLHVDAMTVCGLLCPYH